MPQSRLKRLGTILHFTDLGLAIIKNPPKLPKIGSPVVTETLVHVGVVSDIFGPVKAPYVSIKVKEDQKEKITENTVLYALEEPKKTRGKIVSKRKKQKKMVRSYTQRKPKTRSTSKK